MKPKPITNFDNRNKTLLKKFENDDMWENYDVIVVFLIYRQFGAILKLDSVCIDYKTYIVINSNFLSHENCKQN